MDYLIDAQLPPGLARWLARKGYAAKHVYDFGLGGASDDQIEAKAHESRAVIWSKDADFADRARRNPGLQVVWLRLGNTSNAALQSKLAPILSAIEQALMDGDSLIEIR